ncbi:hypothetical protein NYR75_10225 [Actinobacillus equuli subsp. haemolyticus]|uniref:hypothetical protein n=1 Tax=Actinobacillus equuli TaxID=718 RepID=UPI0024421384|nr:hypothetical protein [Actinobacillus equuli]WGE63111.1 hypothetical protein NYR75_10225 [Actinobacillus equuli subsp. haemolyticus]
MKTHFLELFQSMLIALFIVCVGTTIEPSFFFIDDAQNEFLPFMREIGRIWLNGEVPFILENTFFGSNTLIDLHRAIFLPQNILLAILSTKIDTLTIIANLSATINITIMAFSAIKVAKALNLTNGQQIIIACLFSISPIFLYFYLESWWNGAIGQAWFVAGLATILHLRKQFSSFNLLVNAITVYSILVSGWPHSAVAYALLAGLFCLELLWKKKNKELIIFLIFSFSLICIISPFYSEYLTSSDLISRPSNTNNNGNFLSTTLNQIVFTFNPVYYHFMHKFQGYTITHIPMAYSSIYILLALCFSNLKEVIKDKDIIFISVLSLLFFILNQTPTYLGPLRWVFRFTPYFSELLILLGLLLLSKEIIISRTRIYSFIGVILLSSLLSVFSQEKDFGFITIVQILFIISTLGYLWLFLVKKEIRFLSSLVYTIICFSLMLLVKPNILGYVAMPWVKNEISYENNYSRGYLLSLTNGRQPKDHIEDLNGAQFLLFDLKAINGASPVGNNLVSQVLSAYSSQAYFNAEETINKLSSTMDNVCKFELYNIDVVVINREDLNQNIKDSLKKCRFTHKVVRNQNVDYFINYHFIPKASVSYLSSSLFNFSILEDNYITEKYKVSSNHPGFIFFSRVFWHGYKVTLDGKPLEIIPQDGIFKVEIPRDIKDGIIELSYLPRSWAYSLWILLFGLNISILILYLNRKII